jgi:hypothetical protein
MRIEDAGPENRRFIQWLHDLSYRPALHGSLEPLPDIGYVSSLPALCDQIYPLDLLARAPFEPDLFVDRSILSAQNAAVRDINAFAIQKMPGRAYIYLATNVVEDS